jgi:hypothetical protein
MSFSCNRPFRGFGLVSLAALLAVTALAGCGGSESAGTASQAVAPSSASTGTTGQSSTSASSSTSTSHSGQAPKSTKAPAAGSSEAALPQVGGHLLRQFTGSGNARLGTIVASSPQVLAWSAQHPPIQIFTTHGFILVSSHAPAGSVQLSRGTYSGLRVAAHGSWSIVLRARS